jgi:hypothetical protein
MLGIFMLYVAGVYMLLVGLVATAAAFAVVFPIYVAASALGWLLGRFSRDS